jgi:hypothetical protein
VVNENKLSPRYQDLSREQGFALESRVLQRLMPMLVLSENPELYAVQDYFSNFIKLIYLLIDIGLGNKTVEEGRLEGKHLHGYLEPKNLFIDKSRFAAEAVLCVTDALGDLGLIRYIPRPGLSERDQKNSDITMLVSHGAYTLSEIGMYEEVFRHPAAIDCKYIFNHKQQTEPFVNGNFFARELWSTPGLYTPEIGMPSAFEDLIQGEWKQSLIDLGLSGIVSSYNSFLNGVHVVQNNAQSEPKEIVRTTIFNVKGDVNMSNGNQINVHGTVQGNVFIGEKIEGVTANINASNAPEETKSKLKELTEAVKNMAPSLDEKLQAKVAKNLERLTTEAVAPEPDRDWYEVSAKGLMEAAQTVSEVIGGPVIAAVKSISSLFL